MHLNMVKRGGGVEVLFKYNARDTLIHATTQEDINALLEDGYEVDDDIFPAADNKLSSTGKTELLVYR